MYLEGSQIGCSDNGKSETREKREEISQLMVIIHFIEEKKKKKGWIEE